MPVLTCAAFLFLTYLGAAVPFGLVITTLYGGDADIRTAGSGNIGATNVARVYGWRIAAPALALDLAKGFVPVSLAWMLFPGVGLWWPALVAITAFAGHCFSVFLEFRGGKGVATAAGGMLALTPGPTLLALLLWAAIIALSGRSSVAALGAALSLVLAVWWLDPGVTPAALLLAVGVVFTHVANIRRLVRGEEAQIVRPVRWGRKPIDAPQAQELLEQAPSGNTSAPARWKESVVDPLAPSKE